MILPSFSMNFTSTYGFEQMDMGTHAYNELFICWIPVSYSEWMMNSPLDRRQNQGATCIQTFP